MLFGILLGLLAGAGIASLLNTEKAEAPANESQPQGASTDAGGVVDKLKHHVDEAKAAGKQASEEKQTELRRRYEDLMKGN